MGQKMVTTTLVVLACIAMALAAGAVADRLGVSGKRHPAPPPKYSAHGTAPKREPFDPEKYDPLMVLDKMPAIVDPPTKRAEDVKKEVSDEELILGVELGGESRAYPINQLTKPYREVFNDVLSQTAIAATW